MEPMQLARAVCQPVENVVIEIVMENMERLAQEDILYITSAVWGSIPNRSLDAAQTEIFGRANMAVAEALTRLHLSGLDTSQEFALNYLIRGLMISKLCHAVDIYHLANCSRGRSDQRSSLVHMETLGQA